MFAFSAADPVPSAFSSSEEEEIFTAALLLRKLPSWVYFSEGIKCKVVSLEDGHLRGFLRACGLALIGITQRCVISRVHAWHNPPEPRK